MLMLKIYWVFSCIIPFAVTKRTYDTNRVFYGHMAQPEQFPHQISLAIARWKSLSHLCGGSIIRERLVLSAAHCIIDDLSVHFYRIYAGSTQVLSVDKGTFNTRVGQIIVHPDYDENTLENDIALLTVRTRFPFNEPNIAPVPLALKNPGNQTHCAVSGFGVTEKGILSKVLLYAMVHIYSFDKCLEHDPSLTPGMICAFGSDGEDAGEGDSGGPLTCDGQLVALVSFGYITEGGRKPAFGVYADIPYYRNWIIENRSSSMTNVSICILFSSLIFVEIINTCLQMWFVPDVA